MSLEHQFADFEDHPQNGPCDAPTLLRFAPYSGPTFTRLQG